MTRLLRFTLVLVVGLIALGLLSGQAQAQRILTYVTPGNSAIITVDVLPLQADIVLDGLRIGSAHDLVARTVPVTPGPHVLQVSAPGFIPAVMNVPGTANWANRIQIQLVPERKP
ncbi:MAG TPA: PEGA domain-containing protein [Methylomirabilota bacterium]|nr:PEGA domain-containing protein [Methylomirabilota bacterium]